jgi:hypothetical protein
VVLQDFSVSTVILSAIAGLLALLILSRLIFKKSQGKASRSPYQKHTALFSPDDQAFFRALREAAGEDFEVFGKIRVADIVMPKKGVPRDTVRTAFNPIAGRHFDFVLCDRNSLAVVCAIQLHDKINPARQTEHPDDTLRPICESISLPFVRFHIKADYSAEELRERLDKAMSKEPLYLTDTDGRREPRISGFENLKL